MRILIAFDKFKDSLTALRACEIAARALQDRHPGWETDLCPLSDGGDGFVEILTRAAGGRCATFPVAGPRGGLVAAPVGFVPYSRIPPAARALLGPAVAAGGPGTAAIIEMASASGLALLAPGRRDPWQATSLGTGQLIQAAAAAGAAIIVLGVGGSATHDLGLGALAALGVGFRAADGRELAPPVPAVWPQIAGIGGALLPGLPPIRIACDVTNPLLGAKGAAAVFARQKGLQAADADRLETASAAMATRLCAWAGQPAVLAEVPGAGAAGGIAFGLMAAAGARLLPGFGFAAAWLDLDARIAAADVVITGEGRFDESSLGGKGPGAIAARAQELGKPVHIFAGEIRGIGRRTDAFLHQITPDGAELADALRDGAENLAHAVGRSEIEWIPPRGTRRP